MLLTQVNEPNHRNQTTYLRNYNDIQILTSMAFPKNAINQFKIVFDLKSTTNRINIKWQQNADLSLLFTLHYSTGINKRKKKNESKIHLNRREH